MKLLTPICLLLLLGILAGCTSSEEPVNPVSTPVTGPVSTTTSPTEPASSTITGGLLLGTFVSNVHTTSGIVQLTETDGKRLLVFTNFRTDGGPDLRIYLAENTSLRNFIEVSRLEKRGNFSIELPANANPVQQRYVLIWCKAFSVLFGNAELK